MLALDCINQQHARRRGQAWRHSGCGGERAANYGKYRDVRGDLVGVLVRQLRRELRQHHVDCPPDVDALRKLPLGREDLAKGGAQLCMHLVGQASSRARSRVTRARGSTEYRVYDPVVTRLHADGWPIEGDEEVAERGCSPANDLIAAPARGCSGCLNIGKGEVGDDEGIRWPVMVDAEDVEAAQHTKLALQAIPVDDLEVHQMLRSSS